MNLVSAQRSSQVALEGLEKEVAKLDDHVEDVDDHLRGVAGRESIDTRVTIMEKDVMQHNVLLRQIAKHFGTLETMVGEIRSDIATFKISRSFAEKTEAVQTERFKEWLKFWGPIIIACLALLVPLTKAIVNHWIAYRFSVRPAVYKPDERLRKQIEADKRGVRGRQVKKRLEALEKAATSYQP